MSEVFVYFNYWVDFVSVMFYSSLYNFVTVYVYLEGYTSETRYNCRQKTDMSYKRKVGERQPPPFHEVFCIFIYRNVDLNILATFEKNTGIDLVYNSSDRFVAFFVLSEWLLL